MKNEPGIYSIANTVTGVVYVGAAQNLYRREYHHRWALKLSRHINAHDMLVMI